MQHKIEIENKNGEKLVGVLHEAGSNEIVVVCHGLWCTKEQEIIKNISIALEHAGISVFRFDFTGNGESQGLFQFGYYREVEDIRTVIEYFGAKKRSILAILGHSKGGNVVLIYASKYHDIDVVANVSGRCHLDRGLDRLLGANFEEQIRRDGYIDIEKGETGGGVKRVTEESLIERLNTNMHEVCLSIDKSCRVLTIHGSRDRVVKVEDAEEFNKIIPNHRLHVIKGANHGYTKHQNELASTIVLYMQEYLQLCRDK
ncbi:hypothetical protein F511_21404 [Dorcoceras hygrometricum]|uniref:Serine aminopeptidase S33 domain-containing protein n=1 Tax=Dorcoceras hygrometricum TaxID=472368 RepID=A0A2Z7CH07_9LAMI|nr:hypothetical protein F511_21404 [Dorcoceras hygrometricum]